MGEVDLVALNLSYAQVKVLLGPSATGPARRGDKVTWSCSWADCDWVRVDEVLEDADIIDWPVELVDHIFVNLHYALSTSR